MSVSSQALRSSLKRLQVPDAPRGARGVLDLLAAAVVALGAALVASMGAASDGPLRLVLAGAVVFFIPGYLLLEAVLPAGRPGAGPVAFRMACAVGLSPAIVALAALATALVPGAFTPPMIVAVVSAVCIGFAALAVVRRAARPAPDANEVPPVAGTGIRGG